MATGSQVFHSLQDKYIDDVYVTTKDLKYDVDVMSREDIMTLGMRPINRFRAENRLILPNRNQLISSIVTLCSMVIMTVGVNDLVTTYYYINSSETKSWGCMEKLDSIDFINQFKPISDSMKTIVWIWITCGLWGGILPLCTGFIMNCSTNLSSKSPVNYGTYFGTIFYNANFPYKDPPVKNLLRYLSMIDLVIVFILSVINFLMSRLCENPNYPISKLIFPIIVAILSVVVFILILISPKVKKQNLSRDETLHVGHTHILVRKFPVGDSQEVHGVPELVGYGPPVESPRVQRHPRMLAQEELMNY